MRINYSSTRTLINLVFFLSLFIGMSTSCGDGEVAPKGPIPVINSVSPSSGQVGIAVTIAGLNFGSAQNAKIFFQGPNNTFISANISGTGSINGESLLYTSVPAGSISGKIKVEVNGAAVLSPEVFTVMEPIQDITVDPSSGPIGGTVILSGTTFSSTVADNKVTFTSASGARTIATSIFVGADQSYLVVRIPDSASNGPIQLEVNQTIHASQNFEVRPCNVSTLTGGAWGLEEGSSSSAKFAWPGGMAVIGTTMYVADAGNNRIRKVDLTTGTTSTFAGSDLGFVDGVGAAAQFQGPHGITVGPDGMLYVTDHSNNAIRKINPSTAEVTTVAGNGAFGFVDGIGSVARLNNPDAITTGSDGKIYFTETTDSHAIRRLDPATNEVTTIAGGSGSGFTNGIGTAAKFSFPEGIAEANGFLYIADNANECIRRINLSDKKVETFAGTAQVNFAFQDGIGLETSFNNPSGIVTDGTYLYVSDLIFVRRINLTTGAVTKLAGYYYSGFSPVNGACKDAEFDEMIDITIAPDGSLYVTESSGFSVDLRLVRKIVP